MRGAASSYFNGSTVFVFHLFQRDDSVATGVNDFNAVTHGEFVFGFYLGPAVGHAAHLTHKLAAVAHGMASLVVLVVIGRTAVSRPAV